jgi:hypothetical protein
MLFINSCIPTGSFAKNASQAALVARVARSWASAKYVTPTAFRVLPSGVNRLSLLSAWWLLGAVPNQFE